MSLRGFRVYSNVSGHRRYVLGSDLVGSLPSTGVTPPAETFHLLTEGGDFLITEGSDFLDIEHV